MNDVATEQKQAVAVAKPQREVRVVQDAIPVLDTARFEHMNRIAVAMARGSYIPETLRGKAQGSDAANHEQTIANCFRVVNQAVRWNADPFSIIDGAYILKGKLGFEGKIIAAVVNTSHAIVGRLNYEYGGQKGGDERSVVVSATFADTGETKEIDGTVGDWKTDNKNWTDQPDQQLAYRGAIIWTRRHAPELMLGIYTDDDIERMVSRGALRADVDGTFRVVPEGDRPTGAALTAAVATESFGLYSPEGDLVETIGTAESFKARFIGALKDSNFNPDQITAFVANNGQDIDRLDAEPAAEVYAAIEAAQEVAAKPKPAPKPRAKPAAKAAAPEPEGDQRPEPPHETAGATPAQAAAGEAAPPKAPAAAAKPAEPAKPAAPTIDTVTDRGEAELCKRQTARFGNFKDFPSLRQAYLYEMKNTFAGTSPAARAYFTGMAQARAVAMGGKLDAA